MRFLTALRQTLTNGTRVACVTGWASLVFLFELYPRYDAISVEGQPACAVPVKFPLVWQQELIAHGAFIVMLLIHFSHYSCCSALIHFRRFTGASNWP